MELCRLPVCDIYQQISTFGPMGFSRWREGINERAHWPQKVEGGSREAGSGGKLCEVLTFHSRGRVSSFPSHSSNLP